MSGQTFGLRSYLALALVALGTLTTACSSGGGGSAAPAAPAPGPAPVQKTAVFNPALTAPNFLPALDTEKAPTADRLLLEQTMTQAQTQNKILVLEVRAAWCGPCTQFAYEMDTHPENFKTLADQGVLFVQGEFMKMPARDGLVDFLPYFLKYFPSFYAYVPGQGWSMLAASTFQDLQNSLSVVRNPKLSVDQIKAWIETCGTDETKSLLAGPTGLQLESALYGGSSMYNYGDFRAITQYMRATDAKYPKLQLAALAGMMEDLGLVDYVAAGAITVDNLAIDYPTAAKNMTDVSADDFSPQVYQLEVSNRARKVGIRDAASECDSTWQAERARFTPGTLSPTDFQAKLAEFDKGATIFCAGFEVQASGATDAVKARLAKLDQSRITDYALLAAVGQTQAAVAAYHKDYLDSVTEYQKALTKDNADLTAAQAANDADKIKKATDAIAVQNFQIQYHADVDTTVENALTAGQPISALKLMN